MAVDVLHLAQPFLSSTILDNTSDSGSLHLHSSLLESVLSCEACGACCGGADAPVSSSRMRVAAATALGAAAVKAKMLADVEEREVQRQVQVAVDTQIQKLQLKLNSVSQLEDALEKERSIMEVCAPYHAYEFVAVLRTCGFSLGIIRLVTRAVPLQGCFRASCMLTSTVEAIFQRSVLTPVQSLGSCFASLLNWKGTTLARKHCRPGR